MPRPSPAPRLGIVRPFFAGSRHDCGEPIASGHVPAGWHHTSPRGADTSPYIPIHPHTSPYIPIHPLGPESSPASPSSPTSCRNASFGAGGGGFSRSRLRTRPRPGRRRGCPQTPSRPPSGRVAPSPSNKPPASWARSSRHAPALANRHRGDLDRRRGASHPIPPTDHGSRTGAASPEMPIAKARTRLERAGAVRGHPRPSKGRTALPARFCGLRPRPGRRVRRDTPPVAAHGRICGAGS